MKRNEVKELLDTISAIYSTFNYTAEVFTLWCDALKDCDTEGVRMCLSRCFKTSKFPPHLSDIINLYIEGEKRMRSEISWQWSNNILPSLSDINHTETVEECQKLYLDFMDKIPLVNKATIANRIGKSLYAYAKTLGKKEFNFSEWLKEIANEL